MSERLEQTLRGSSAPAINLSMSNSFATAPSPRITSDSIQRLGQEEDDDLELEDLDAGIPSNSYCASFANFVLNLPTQFLSMLNTLYSWVASFFNTDAQPQSEDPISTNPTLPQATEGEVASPLLNLEQMGPRGRITSFSPLLPKSQINGDALVAALKTLPNEIQIKDFSLNSYVELASQEISDELLGQPENLLKAFKTLPSEIQRMIRCDFASASNLGITGDEDYQREAKLLAIVNVQTIEGYITRWPTVFYVFIRKEVAKLEEQSFGLFYLLKFSP
jgi:hypothetical protein